MVERSGADWNRPCTRVAREHERPANRGWDRRLRSLAGFAGMKRDKVGFGGIGETSGISGIAGLGGIRGIKWDKRDAPGQSGIHRDKVGYTGTKWDTPGQCGISGIPRRWRRSWRRRRGSSCLRPLRSARVRASGSPSAQRNDGAPATRRAPHHGAGRWVKYPGTSTMALRMSIWSTTTRNRRTAACP